MFALAFDTDNDAFATYNEERNEICRILGEIREKVELGAINGKILDSNGNRIGEWSLSDLTSEG